MVLLFAAMYLLFLSQDKLRRQAVRRHLDQLGELVIEREYVVQKTRYRLYVGGNPLADVANIRFNIDQHSCRAKCLQFLAIWWQANICLVM